MLPELERRFDTPKQCVSKLTQIMIEVQERQRSGIATALHNDVSQRLTVLQIGIERLKTEVPSARAAFKAQLEKPRRR
jgi:signal transduction histidine kinase